MNGLVSVEEGSSDLSSSAPNVSQMINETSDKDLKGILLKGIGEDQTTNNTNASESLKSHDEENGLEENLGDKSSEKRVAEADVQNSVEPTETDDQKKEDDSKAVTFAEDVEVFDLSKASTALNVPSSKTEQCISEDVDSKQSLHSQKILPEDQKHCITKELQNTDSKANNELGPSDLETAHRSLTEDPVLAAEQEYQEPDLGGSVKDVEKEPLLENVPSTPSDNLSQGGYIDTIGPLENEDFLRRMHSSVSHVYGEDSGFQAASNLDLVEFTGEGNALPDIDRGYAWIILASAVAALALLGATTIAAGILMPAILEQIDPDITKASWIGSVHVSTMCMSGPFVGVVLNRLGSRLTVLIAGVVLSLGFIGASFAQSVLQLILTHGLVSGIGSGFVLNTMFVTAGQRFNRFRGLACGLLATGTGVGLLAGGSALSTLLNSFGLRGTYLLWAGILLHIFACGMFLRPSGEQKLRTLEVKAAKSLKFHQLRSEQSLTSGRQSMASGVNSILSSVDRTSMFSGRSSVHRRPEFHRFSSRANRYDPGANPLLRDVLHRETSRSSHSVATFHSQKSNKKSNDTGSQQVVGRFTFAPAAVDSQSAFTSSPGNTPVPSSPIASDCSDNDTSPTEPGPPHVSSTLSVPQRISDGKASHTNLENDPQSPTSEKETSEFGGSFRRRLISTSSQTQSHYTSMSHISQRSTLRDLLPKEYDNESLASTLVSALQPVDALTPRYRLGPRSVSTIMGSILSFPTALTIVKDDLSQLGDLTIAEEKTIGDHLISLLDSLRLLKNKPFLVFIVTCFLWSFGESPIAIYLPSYAVSQGTSILEASSLYTAMGLGSMIGRFLSGLIASDCDIGPILLHTGCLSIAGCLVVLSPLITATFSQQLLLSGVFGLYTGSLVPLSSLITIELLGIEELGLGYGFLSLFQGVGYLIGPPLAGIIVAAIGYEKAFIFSGCILICASLMEMLTVVFLRRAIEQNTDTNSLDDLERALRKISDHESDDEEETKASRLSLSKSAAGSLKTNLNQDVEVDKKAGGDENIDTVDSGPVADDVLEPIAEEVEKQSFQGLDT
ncbi:uncharacterized protein LOC101852300 [Aplysia californica]|uniref:Uncharacterized protein LOC101852300 n=1 Tax=Aplysia californica TaxID=6500 RepID=A0ABM0JCT4_APLCA|nr:uncharacterized protein LOC101852300 [Aplysia californica]